VQTNSGQIELFDSIVYGNTAPIGADLYLAGSSTSSGGNLYGQSNVTLANSTHDPNDNPGLGALQYNGGPTQTMALLPKRLAVLTGLAAGAPSTDQRGFQRMAVGGKIDTGAFENQRQLFSFTGPSNQSSTAGSSASFNLGSFNYSGSTGNIWVVD